MAFQFPANPWLALLATLAGCSSMKIEGDCSYERNVTTTYVCQPDSQLEHIRIGPPPVPD